MRMSLRVKLALLVSLSVISLLVLSLMMRGAFRTKDGPDRLARMSGGFLQFAHRVRNVTDENAGITNYMDLCKRLNAAYPSEDRISTNGNPCPGLFPIGKYYWRAHWPTNVDAALTPLLWSYCNYESPLAYYVTLAGEKRVAKSNDFARMWHLTNLPIVEVE
jgi:hypothetical protein